MTVLAPTSNVCLCVGGPDGVQEEHRRFILVWSEKFPTSSGGGEFCIILHRSACSGGYKRVREGGGPKSQGVSGMCACDSAGDLARSRRVVCSCVYLVLFRCSWSSSPSETVPACSFYSIKEVQGYKMLVRGAILVGEGAQRPREGLIWWRRGLHCRGMALVLLALLLLV
jgi:hypothetical protein